MATTKVAFAQIHYKPCYWSDTHDFIVEPFGDDLTTISSLQYYGIDKLHMRIKKTIWIGWR